MQFQHRFQEVVVYDTVAGKVFIRQAYDKSISFLIPAYDEDSKLLFLGAKGSTLIRHIDVTNMDVASRMLLSLTFENIYSFKQTKSAALVKLLVFVLLLN